MDQVAIDASNIRRKIVELTMQSGEGHLASSFSIVEMLMAVYSIGEQSGGFKPQNFYLSKAHASYAFYAFMNEIYLFSDEELRAIGAAGSRWYGHLPYITGDPRFHFGAGSLGHGLPFSLGYTLSLRRQNCFDKVVCLIGDGEANEGTFWETLLLINKFRPSNFKIMVDCNNSSERAIPIIECFAGLYKSFAEIDFLFSDGHSVAEMSNLIEDKRDAVIFCRTEKGFPVDFMIDNPAWHHKIPTADEAQEISGRLP